MATTLYLDQSDVSLLALDHRSALDVERHLLERLARSGRVRLLVSVAHLAETAQLSFKRCLAIMRYLNRLPGTVYAHAAPNAIYSAESLGKRVDMRELPVRHFGLRATMEAAVLAAHVVPIADAVAQSDNFVRDEMLARQGLRLRLRLPALHRAPGPATALYEVLRRQTQWGLQRPTRRSDTIDGMHLAYACYSDVATVDGFVYETTKKARAAHCHRTRWFRTGSLAEVLAHV